jgi:CheY-like chemotaxis protein
MSLQMLDLTAIRVLIVDDNQNMQSIVKYALRALGLRDIHTAIDGEKGYAKYLACTPDIIITNWMMDNVNGLEFTRNIRTADNSKNPHIPIIMLTAYTEHERITQARDAGITEFLAKPVSPRSIYLRIAQVILKPRQVVKTDTYFGPDRRRQSSNEYSNQNRRKTDKKPAKR